MEGSTPRWPHFLSQGGEGQFQQLFSARDGIAPPPPPRHHLETFLPQLKGHGWHLVDRQGSRSMCRAQDKTLSQEKSSLVAKRLRKPKPETERDPKREEGPGSDVQSGPRLLVALPQSFQGVLGAQATGWAPGGLASRKLWRRGRGGRWGGAPEFFERRKFARKRFASCKRRKK